jgi:hypothetical protein
VVTFLDHKKIDRSTFCNPVVSGSVENKVITISLLNELLVQEVFSMGKNILACLVICLIFFYGFAKNIFAQDQPDLKGLTHLMNHVFQGPTDLGPWRYTSSMVFPRAAGSAVICGEYIYFIGGSDTSTVYNTVERAKINSDGTLGKWVLESDTLLIPVFGAAAVSKNGYIYVIAGAVQLYNHTNVVQYTKANPDGTLQPWQLTSPVLEARALYAFAEYQDYIYIMGGSLGSGDRLNSVEYARINPDGTLGNWSYTSSMQAVRWQPSGEAHNGYVYVLGGADWGGATSTVEYAKINPDGSLGSWSYTSSMTVPRSDIPGRAVLNDYLYAFGGVSLEGGYGRHNTVEKALINPDGTLGSWSLQSDTLLDPVSVAGCDQKNGHVYMAGGLVGPVGMESTSDDVLMTGVSFLVGGDANCDGVIDVSDVVYLLNYLFIGGPPPGCP